MNNFFKGLGEFFTALGECCMPSKKEREIHPPATATNFPSATQSNFSKENQEMMILILKNYNQVFLKIGHLKKQDLFDGIDNPQKNQIKDYIKTWNKDKFYKVTDSSDFHRIFREKLKEHLQEIKKITPENFKDAKFDALLTAIKSPIKEKDSDPSHTEIKKGLANLITEAKDGKKIYPSSYR